MKTMMNRRKVLGKWVRTPRGIFSIVIISISVLIILFVVMGGLHYLFVDSMGKLGIFGMYDSYIPPTEARYLGVRKVSYPEGRVYRGQLLILKNAVDPGDFGWWMNTEAKIEEFERLIEEIPDGKFWGVALPELTRRYRMELNDSCDTDFFGYRMMGYSKYREGEDPGASIDEWLDEMYLRFLKGYCEHLRSRGMKVGHQFGINYIPGYQGKTPNTIEHNFGRPGWDYIMDEFDFLLTWSNIENEEQLSYLYQAMNVLDTEMRELLIMWVVTEPYPDHAQNYEEEILPIEIDVVYPHVDVLMTRIQKIGPPGYEETWAMLVEKVRSRGR